MESILLANKKILTHSSRETSDIGLSMARELLKESTRGDRTRSLPKILCLYGDLGSGKTTFTQGFAKGLGYTGRLPSPTFIIVRRYGLPMNDFLFYHVDLYRLRSFDELVGVGLKEIFEDSQSFTVVEWADRLGKLVPSHRIDMRFEQLSENEHSIVVQFV